MAAEDTKIVRVRANVSGERLAVGDDVAHRGAIPVTLVEHTQLPFDRRARRGL